MKRTTFLAATLFAASAHAQPATTAPAIELAVTGSIDAGVVATSIATELATPVTPLAANQACHAPCLAVAVQGTAATVTFTTATGGTRQRTIELGGDRAQWPELLTLLAGNLVRDEAADLLAEAPAPPGEPADATVAPPAAAMRVAMAPERVSPVSFGLFPGVSTNLFDLQRSTRSRSGSSRAPLAT